MTSRTALFASRKSLIVRLVKQAIVERYRGALLSVIWALLYPLALLAIYGTVFIYILQVRWQEAPNGSPLFSALMLFIGLIMHHMLAESFHNAVSLMQRNTHYVKKMVFPLEILVPVQVISIFSQLLIPVGLVMAFSMLSGISLTASILYMPLIIGPFFLIALGFCWMIAALSVYIRDIAQLMGLATMLLLFGSTILFPAEKVPEALRVLLYLNPLSYVTDSMRAILLTDNFSVDVYYGLFLAASLCISSMGYYVFRRLQVGFADML